MLEQTQDNEQVVERIAALDIGKAELVCCARVPDPKASGKRLQEVTTHSTMTRSGQAHWGGVCQGPLVSAQGRSWDLPGDGHEFCPVMAMGSAHC
ncbi:MAG: hypothetical protein ACRCYX_00660 [Dermatophilaceae bacterium]